MSGCRLLIEVVEACEHFPATRIEEGVFGGGPALGNDFTNVVIQGELFQEQELWHALHTLCLRNRAGHQGDIRTWCDGMSPFDIKSGLGCPADHRSIVWIERFGAERSIHFEGGRIRYPKCRVKSMQVAGNSRATKGVNDDNCLAFTIIASTEQAIYAIGSAYFLRIITGDSTLLATLLIRRRGRTTLYKAVTLALEVVSNYARVGAGTGSSCHGGNAQHKTQA